MTGNQNDASGPDALRDAVRDAVEQGLDVQDTVRQITLKAMTKGQLDTEAMRQVANQVAEGMRLGAAKHGGQAREVLEKALRGFDDAFAKGAEAATLAARELSGKAHAFTSGDLQRAMEDLRKFEGLTTDALRKAAAGSLAQLSLIHI